MCGGFSNRWSAQQSFILWDWPQVFQKSDVILHFSPYAYSPYSSPEIVTGAVSPCHPHLGKKVETSPSIIQCPISLFNTSCYLCGSGYNISNYRTRMDTDGYPLIDSVTHPRTHTHRCPQNTVHPDTFQPFLSLSPALMLLQLPPITALGAGG